MLSELLLLSGNDIPFPEAGVTIHPPSIKEIAYIGEENFFTGCELLNFSKNILNDEDKSRLEHLTNFEVLMSIMNDTNVALRKQRACMLLVLSLIFPNYQISLTRESIVLTLVDEKDFVIEKSAIDKNNFENFKLIIQEMLCLKTSKVEEEYNPTGDLAKKIADKLKARQRKLAELKGQNQVEKIAIFSRYVSILTVGENKDMNSLMQYTIYQLFDEYKRFELKMRSDWYLQARLAGAKDLDEVEDWMKDIHSQ